MLSIDGHLCCFYFLAVVNNVAVKQSCTGLLVDILSLSLFSCLSLFPCLCLSLFSLHTSVSFSHSLFVRLPLSISVSLPPALLAWAGGRGLTFLHPSPPSLQHFMKPLQRFLKPDDIETIFINIEVSRPVPSPQLVLLSWPLFHPPLGDCELGNTGQVGDLLLSPGCPSHPHPSLWPGPASCAHSLPKGDEGSPGYHQCTNPLPGLHQIQGEVRPGWPAYSPTPQAGRLRDLALRGH